MINQPPNVDFYEVGREYYFVDPNTGRTLPIMTVVTGPAIYVTDPRTNRPIWAHPTLTKGVYGDDSFSIYVVRGQLTPVERPSGEEKIFSQFVK